MSGAKMRRSPHIPINQTLVMYLQHHRVELSVLVQLPGTSEDGGGLACSRGTIEQEMGELVLTDEPLD